MPKQIEWPLESLDSAPLHALAEYLLDHQMLGEPVLQEQKQGPSQIQLIGRWIIAAAKLTTVVAYPIGMHKAHCKCNCKKCITIKPLSINQAT